MNHIGAHHRDTSSLRYQPMLSEKYPEVHDFADLGKCELDYWRACGDPLC